MSQLRFLSFTIFCFFVGLAGHAAFDKAFEPTRIERLTRLFERACLQKRTAPPSQRAIALDLLPISSFGTDQNDWVDPDTKAFVRFGDTRCSVKLHQPFSIPSGEDAEALLNIIADLAVAFDPALKRDPKAVMGDHFRAWTNWETSAPGSPDRWGIIAWVEDYGEDHRSTSLIFSFPNQLPSS